MLQSRVGPPMVGATELKSSPEKSAGKNFKGTGSESAFGKTLEEKVSSKSPKETKDSVQSEMRPKDKAQTADRSEKEEKPQQAEAKQSESTVKSPDGKLSKKATVRQKAIQEFMDSFESEFEISPTRLVEAMAKLDDTQLVQSPEVTADAVIDQLDLSDEDADKARAMYTSLLIQLEQMPQQPKPAPDMAAGLGMSHPQMQARIAAAQDKQNVMAASADRVTKNFWMQQEPKAVPLAPAEFMPSLDGSLAQRMMMEEAPELAEMPEMEVPQPTMPEVNPEAPKLKELPPHLRGQMKEAIAPSLLAALAAKQAQAQNTGALESEASDETSQLMTEFQQAAQAPKLDKVQGVTPGAIAGVPPKANPEFFQNQSQGQSLMQQNPQGSMPKSVPGEKEAVSKLVEKASDFKQSLTGLEGLHGAPIKGESLKMDAVAPMVAPAPTAPANPAENEAAVKQIMNQAQYLIKKGGGEMKVQMTPEGMGTIHLKVMLQDGKVNMQMSADTQEAKKTIESSLAELKTSLAAHKLSMENVKVDVVNSASSDTATQNQTNMNGQNQRDQTRQFWNQFNENFGSQGRRESLTEMPNLRGYGNRSRDPLAPIESSSTSQARKVEGKGRGLNLVA